MVNLGLPAQIYLPEMVLSGHGKLLVQNPGMNFVLQLENIGTALEQGVTYKEKKIINTCIIRANFTWKVGNS
jgi:hypothetical protein